jgi:hypothetical protein
MYTYAGDANLDGKIDISDYGLIDSAVRIGLSGWFNGDFNYDGKIDILDYGIIDSNVRVQGPPLVPAPQPPAGLAPIPEPVTLAPLASVALLLLRRCRRRVS